MIGYIISIGTMISEAEFNKLYLDKDFKRQLFYRISKVQKKTGLPLDKDDLFQDIFLEIWAKRADWDSNLGVLSAWATTVASRVVSNYVRNEMRRLSRESPPDTLELGWDDEGNLEPIDDKLTPEGHLESAHAQYEILGAVNQLPEDLRDVLRLHLEGLSGKQVAEKLGISEPLARKRLERARKRLKN